MDGEAAAPSKLLLLLPLPLLLPRRAEWTAMRSLSVSDATLNMLAVRSSWTRSSETAAAAGGGRGKGGGSDRDGESVYGLTWEADWCGRVGGLAAAAGLWEGRDDGDKAGDVRVGVVEAAEVERLVMLRPLVVLVCSCDGPEVRREPLSRIEPVAEGKGGGGGGGL